MRQVVVISQKGGYSVSVPSLPGCTSQGKTIEEAMTNIKTVIESQLERIRERGKRVPKDVEVYVLRVDVD